MNPPNALVTLKRNSGENWIKIKKYLVQYLDIKRGIFNSNLSKKSKTYFDGLAYKDILSKNFFTGEFVYETSTLSKEEIISYGKNVLAALHKRDYDSQIMCYITDSFNTAKSGNKKYPQFN